MEIGGKSGRGIEDKKETGLCRECLGVERDRDGEGRAEFARGMVNGSEMRERGRETEGELLESVVECRRREKDRRKQAAIVSDDSLVATHVILSRLRQPPPFNVPLFRSFRAVDNSRVPFLVSLTDWLTKSLPTPLPHCDNLIARSETECDISPPPYLSVSRFRPSFSSLSSTCSTPRVSRRNRCTCIEQSRRH